MIWGTVMFVGILLLACAVVGRLAFNEGYLKGMGDARQSILDADEYAAEADGKCSGMYTACGAANVQEFKTGACRVCRPYKIDVKG